MKVYVPPDKLEEFERIESDNSLERMKNLWVELSSWQKYQLCLIACKKDGRLPLKARISLFVISTFYFLTLR